MGRIQVPRTRRDAGRARPALDAGSASPCIATRSRPRAADASSAVRAIHQTSRSGMLVDHVLGQVRGCPETRAGCRRPRGAAFGGEVAQRIARDDGDAPPDRGDHVGHSRRRPVSRGRAPRSAGPAGRDRCRRWCGSPRAPMARLSSSRRISMVRRTPSAPSTAGPNSAGRPMADEVGAERQALEHVDTATHATVDDEQRLVPTASAISGARRRRPPRCRRPPTVWTDPRVATGVHSAERVVGPENALRRAGSGRPNAARRARPSRRSAGRRYGSRVDRLPPLAGAHRGSISKRCEVAARLPGSGRSTVTATAE